MMPLLVAARLGGWKDDEAVATAYARALDAHGGNVILQYLPEHEPTGVSR
jgi:hypothetical protein